MWRSGVTSVRELWAMQTRPVHRFPVHPVHVFFSLNVEKEQDQNTSRAMDFT
jgi:hypothetical protein